MFENRIKTQTNKELENSKGFFHDKIVQLLRLGAAQANVQKAISGEITYEHRFRKIDRNSPHIRQLPDSSGRERRGVERRPGRASQPNAKTSAIG